MIQVKPKVAESKPVIVEEKSAKIVSDARQEKETKPEPDKKQKADLKPVAESKPAPVKQTKKSSVDKFSLKRVTPQSVEPVKKTSAGKDMEDIEDCKEEDCEMLEATRAPDDAQPEQIEQT